MNAVVPIAMRFVHIASVIVLLGGIYYARFAAGEMSLRFKPVIYTVIVTILISGLYQFLTKPLYPATYQMMFGIKVLLALHVFAAAVLYRKGKERALTGVVISGALIVAISSYLRYISLK
ncbi:MAG TPA: hypothetical protein VK419_08300 [Bryobacteraceae bacterium]|nr:hypothetical protein [Bryobacteraceae bacterium]